MGPLSATGAMAGQASLRLGRTFTPSQLDSKMQPRLTDVARSVKSNRYQMSSRPQRSTAPPAVPSATSAAALGTAPVEST
jgi:hypothetical protein